MPILSTAPPSNVVFGGGRMTLTSADAVRFWHSAADMFYPDVRVAVEHGNEVNPTANDYVGATVRRIDGENMLIGAVTSDHIHAMKFEDGDLWELASVPLVTPLLLDNRYWVQASILDDHLVVTNWDRDPRDVGDPLDTLAYDLTPTEAARFSGNYTFSVGAFWWQQDSWASAYLESFQYDPVRLIDTLILELDHNGNYTAKPIIELVGEMEDVVLTNQMNGQSVVVDNVIPEGESRIADIADKTFNDAYGANKYDDLAMNNKWMKLESGVNQIVITAGRVKGNAGVKITWRNSTV